MGDGGLASAEAPGGGAGRDAGSAAAAVVHMLHERGETLAVVESLTGGMLAATIVEIAGVSSVFRGGLVVYSTDLKASLAEVPASLLAERGPVDPDVAVAMAEGGRRRCGSDWCLSVTGVAGPRPQGACPVGLVFIAVTGPTGAQVRRLELGGTRTLVRVGAVTSGLRLLAEQLRAAISVPAGHTSLPPPGSLTGPR